MKLDNKIKDLNALVEQYKLTITMADKISDRRAIANNFFLTLNTMVVSINGIFGNKFILLHLVAITICVVWFLLLNNYKKLNNVKFRIINKLEKELPKNIMAYEWHLLQREKHKTFFSYEKWIPIVFILFYVISLLYNLLPYLDKFKLCFTSVLYCINN